ncbi:MAG: hypothetical protein ACI83B_000393 [Sediminicola sp.]|jgi:hypothetical protein
MLSKVRKIGSNALGWRTNRKILVIESDDWGSVRTRDLEALSYLKEKGFEVDKSNFVKFDSLESDDDLYHLFEVLQSVKDKNGRAAVFTPMTIMGNPDFRQIEKNEFQLYAWEPFTATGKKYKGSEGLIDAYQVGVQNQVFIPEYHGREHLNHLRWMRGLKASEKGILEPFKVGSFGLGRVDGTAVRDHLAAYDPEFKNDIPLLMNSLAEGLDLFEEIFGYKASYFVASKSPEPKKFEQVLAEKGVMYLTRYKLQRYPLGDNKYEREINWIGKKTAYGQTMITRNAGFEPSEKANFDWVNNCLAEINLAFRLKKPAVISSHRVNYVSRLSNDNRSNGLKQLRRLLTEIVSKWPDVEFMSSAELGQEIGR